MIRTVELGQESYGKGLPLKFNLDDRELLQVRQGFMFQNISLSAEMSIERNDAILLDVTSDKEVEIEIYCFSQRPPPPGFKPCPEAGVIKSSTEQIFTGLGYNEPKYRLSRRRIDLTEPFTTALNNRWNDIEQNFMAVTFFENRNSVFLIIRLFAEF